MTTHLSRGSRKPGFFREGVLILLPVALLAGVGVLSLRHDRVVAEHEARQRAQEVADWLAPKLWNEIALTNFPPTEGISFLVDSNADLVFPPPCPITPAAVRFDTSLLSSNEARLWRMARAAEGAPGERPAALSTYRALATSDLPDPFAAAAEYSVGLLSTAEGRTDQALKSFQRVIERFPEARGESGLPLEPLARLKSLELATRKETAPNPGERQSVEALCSNVVSRPSQLSPEILRRVLEQVQSPAARVSAAGWQRTWEDHEARRETYSTLLATGVLTNTPTERSSAFWSAGDPSWLVIWSQTATGRWYCCRSEKVVGTALTKLVEREKQIPDYFGIGIDVAGKRLTWPAPSLRMWGLVNYFGREGGGRKKEYLEQTATNVLASAQSAAPGATIKASVYLTSPGALYERERVRMFWFAALIASAATAAGIGFLTAYRAFHHQLRLGELKSNFVSSVSHELRAPVASVRLMAESLERGKIPDAARQQEYFRLIRQECHRLSALVENVLDFSRIEQGRKQYEFEPTDLGLLTQQTVKLMQTYAEEKGVRLTMQPPEPVADTPKAQPALDGKALQQALINLIDNAIKHSPKGETVLVGLEWAGAEQPVSDRAGKPVVGAAEPKESSVFLWVEDHGPGIPPAEHRKIFQRFYRLGSELRRETQGVGIGLSIVEHVVEAHGGRVLLRSGIGQGSRFTIQLPVRDDAAARDEMLTGSETNATSET